ncbi:MAG: hypothetical protein ACW99G_00495 [Candidatus Thorarchaeota archaeon]|jgi:hypothetical protein
MPFKSDQQRKACFATDGFGGKVDCKAWAEKSKGKKLPHKVKSFKEWLLDENDLAGLEKALASMNIDASTASGNPGYPKLNKARQEILAKIGNQRTLSREEFINLHGYEAWRNYVEKHGLPEDHEFADAHEA